MYQLDTEELIVVLRALYWYEDKLTNTADQHKDAAEIDRVVWLRMNMGNKLKYEARID